MQDSRTTLADTNTPVRGQVDRFDTFQSFGDYFRKHLFRILIGMVVWIFSAYYLQKRIDFDDQVFSAIVLSGPFLFLLSIKLLHKHYSKPGYIQVTDQGILHNVDGHELTYSLAGLRDVDLPSKKELGRGVDYIYLHFGSGDNLELEQWIPQFSLIKRAIMCRIAMHPDLDFLRRRLSKGPAA
jgi:hypothetical protein